MLFRSRSFRAIIVLPFILGVVVFSMPPLRAEVPVEPAAIIELADTFILNYDKKGRATGLKSRKSKNLTFTANTYIIKNQYFNLGAVKALTVCLPSADGSRLKRRKEELL